MVVDDDDDDDVDVYVFVFVFFVLLLILLLLLLLLPLTSSSSCSSSSSSSSSFLLPSFYGQCQHWILDRVAAHMIQNPIPKIADERNMRVERHKY